MASRPIISWQIDGEPMEIVTNFILGGSKITADGHYSLEIKREITFMTSVSQSVQSLSRVRLFATS